MKKAVVKKAPAVTPFTLVGLAVLGVLLAVLYYAASRPTSSQSQAALTCPERCEKKICNSVKDEEKRNTCIEVCEEILCNYIKTCEQKCDENRVCNGKEGAAKTDCIAQCKKSKCAKSYREVKDIVACRKKCDETACTGVKEENRPACISRCKQNCR